MADPTAAQRKMFAKMGLAMPDGSYYIRNGVVGASDLENAIKAVGRGEAAGDSGAAIRKHIMARAAKLKLSSKIPDTWNPDGSLKVEHSDLDSEIEDFLAHFGVKGMHWGVRKAGDHENGAGGSIKETASKTAHKHVGATSVAVGVGAAIATSRITGRPALGVAAGIGAAFATHHALTNPHDLDHHVEHGKTFVANHPAVKK